MDDWQYKAAGDHGLSEGERLRSVKRESGLVSKIVQSVWRCAVWTYLRVYHRLKIEGVEHLPAGAPFILVANHTSHLDAITLAAALPWRLRQSAFPIAAGDVFFETAPAAIFSAMTLNALPMWRKSCGCHALKELRERLLDDPAIFILFPEGTRSRDGKLGRFKPGLGMLVAESEVPVIPCHLHGAFAACPPDRKLPLPKTLLLRIGKPLRFDHVANDRTGWQEIATRAEEAVIRLRDSATN